MGAAPMGVFILFERNGSGSVVRSKQRALSAALIPSALLTEHLSDCTACPKLRFQSSLIPLLICDPLLRRISQYSSQTPSALLQTPSALREERETGCLIQKTS